MEVQKTDIFYHGSRKIFTQFDELMSYGSKRRFVIGAFWFSSNEKVAKSYGKIIYKVNLKVENPFVVDADGESFSEIYLSQLPQKMCLEIDRIDNKRPGDTFNTFNYRKRDDPDFALRFATDELAMAAKYAGYDSLIIYNTIDAGNKKALNITSNIFSVFNNNQIIIQEVINL